MIYNSCLLNLAMLGLKHNQQENKMINAILIDPKEKTLTEVSFDGWEEINTLIGSRTFTIVPMSRGVGGDTLYVDDEGMLNDGAVSFYMGNNNNHLFGKGLFLGSDDEGNDLDSALSVEELAAIVDFDRQMFILDGGSLTISSCNDFPIVVSYQTDEGWCYHTRCVDLPSAYAAWTFLEESGIEFNAIKIEKK